MACPSCGFVAYVNPRLVVTTLPVTDAVLGTKLEVETLEGGKTEVSVPAGIQPDTVLRLRNKGLPRFGGKGRGDLYLRVKVQIPEKPGREVPATSTRLPAPVILKTQLPLLK